MARLSKLDQKAHAAAMDLVNADRPLTLPERELIIETYREDAQHLNGVAGAFFTPMGLCDDLALHVPDGARVLDLCAGIGRLSWAVGFQGEGFAASDGASSIVCVEQNPDYVRVGRAVLPRAMWVQADAFDISAYQHLGPFDVVISNPPFGRIKTGERTIALSRYTGGLFEFRLIELAHRLTDLGVFIVPRESAPFLYSGNRHYERRTAGKAVEFMQATGIKLRANIGIDTSVYRDEWHGPSVTCEIVTFNKVEDRLERGEAA